MGLLILYAVLSIFFSFMCSILEAALLSFTPSFIKMKTAEGKGYATTLSEIKKDIDKPLIAILTVNTIAHTVGAILVGNEAGKLALEGGICCYCFNNNDVAYFNNFRNYSKDHRGYLLEKIRSFYSNKPKRNDVSA